MSVFMSWGLTLSTRVGAHRTASGLDSVVATPSRSARSWARSSRRQVTINSARVRPPDRINPHTSASPIRPPPRKATFRSVTLSSTPPREQIGQEKPHVSRSLGQPPGQIGIPLRPVGDVHPNRLPLPDQRLLEVPADAVQHLELVATVG